MEVKLNRFLCIPEVCALKGEIAEFYSFQLQWTVLQGALIATYALERKVRAAKYNRNFKVRKVRAANKDNHHYYSS